MTIVYNVRHIFNAVSLLLIFHRLCTSVASCAVKMICQSCRFVLLKSLYDPASLIKILSFVIQVAQGLSTRNYFIIIHKAMNKCDDISTNSKELCMKMLQIV